MRRGFSRDIGERRAAPNLCAASLAASSLLPLAYRVDSGRPSRYSLRMDIDWIRERCLALAHTTEKIQWEDALVFKVGGKMYAVVSLEPGDTWLSFKCSDENFADLTGRPGVIPAPYMARAQWVALETETALPRTEIQRLLGEAHALIFAKLPKKTQSQLTASPRRTAPARKPRKASRRRAARKSK